MFVIAIVLFVIGISMGSFVNAVVFRLHEQSRKPRAKSRQLKANISKATAQNRELSIVYGRSMCVHCKHELAWYDLIPILSWLILRGKCRYCSQPISAQYPIVELVGGIVFAGSYLFWPGPVHLNGQWLLLGTWLVASVGLLALAVYDLRWMLLPNKIIYPTLLVAVAGRLGYIAVFDKRPLHSLFLWALSVIIASGIFFGLFVISKGKWIGYGDVRLGLITGTLLATPQKSFAMIFLASLIGSLIVIPSLAAGKRTMASKLPYGPFLIAATAILVISGDALINWYKGLIL